MSTTPDIIINLPAEHLESLLEVISTGLKKTTLKPEIRRELEAWWQAEKSFLEDELEMNE